MTNSTKIEQTIYLAINEVNQTLEKEQQLTKTIETELFGNNGKLDSLGLVNFIVTLEQYIASELDKNVLLASEKSLSTDNSPFRTVKTLVAYIKKLL